MIGRGMAFGRRAAIATVFGNTVGVYVQVIALALGLSAVIQRSETVFTAIKLAGAAYLVVLGIRAIRWRRRPVSASPSARPTAPNRASRRGDRPSRSRALPAAIPQVLSETPHLAAIRNRHNTVT